MSQQTAASPVQFEDYLGNELHRGDIITYTYDKYGSLTTGVVESARKTPKLYTLSVMIVQRYQVSPDLTKTTLNDTTPKFCRVCVVPDSTPNIPTLLLSESHKLRLDGKPLALPEKVQVMHSFDDFEWRWMKGLKRTIDNMIRSVQVHRQDVLARQKMSGFSTYYRNIAPIRFTTAFGPLTYYTTLSVSFDIVNTNVNMVSIRVREGRQSYQDKVSFELTKSPYGFSQVAAGDFDGKKLIATDIEALTKVLFNA